MRAQLDSESPVRGDAGAPPCVQAQAFWFGSAEAPLFGWYHAATAPQRECGVVLCPPFGHEYLVSYRAYRKLAQALAAAGFPCLFFDYQGCGDSSDSLGPQASHWERNIEKAIVVLRECSSVRKCALFGVRLGALLAANIACRTDVAALMLLAPVVTGRAYVRELQAFARMSAVSPSPDPARAVRADEVAGYCFGAEDQALLGAMDLRKSQLPTGTVVFLGRRDDVDGSEDKLLAHWQSQGLNIALATHGGYAAMMTDEAESSVVPDALWREIVDWLSQQFGIETHDLAAKAVRALPGPQALIPLGDGSIAEEAVCFDGLCGVLSRAVAVSPSRVAVVLNNIGTGHRVGNHRIYVQMARALAAQGLDCLRFDRSGCGYSRSNPDGSENQVYTESGTQDLRRAMDFMESVRGQKCFALAGMCSGAYFSYEAALADPRVKGLIMINNQTFTPLESVGMHVQSNRRSVNASRYYVRAVLSKGSWSKLARGELSVERLGKIAQQIVRRMVARLRQAAAQYLGLGAAMGGWQSRVGASLTALLQRHVQILFICGADDGAVDIARLALGAHIKSLGQHPDLRMAIIPHTDHMFTPRWSQRELIALLAGEALRVEQQCSGH